MRKWASVIAAACAVLAISSFAAYYTPEQQESYDSVAFAGYELGTNSLSTANHWTLADPEGAEVVALDDETQALVVDSAYGDATTYTATGTSTDDVRSFVYRAQILFMDPDALTDIGPAQASIVAQTNGEGVASWYGWSKTGDDETGWVKLSGHTPVTNGWYDIRYDFDNRNSKRLVYYFVKGTNETTYTALKIDGTDETALTNGVSSGTISNVAFSGDGVVGDFTFNQIWLVKASYNGTSYRTVTAALAAANGESWANGALTVENADTVSTFGLSSGAKLAFARDGAAVTATSVTADDSVAVTASDVSDGQTLIASEALTAALAAKFVSTESARYTYLTTDALKIGKPVEIASAGTAEGFAFTNGTVSVTATKATEGAEAAVGTKLELVLKKLDGTVVATLTNEVTESGTVAWNVPLDPGKVYDAKVTVLVGGNPVTATQKTEVLAGNNTTKDVSGNDDWLLTDYTHQDGVGGAWNPALEWDDESKTASFETNAFTLTSTASGLTSNTFVTVDTIVTYNSALKYDDFDALPAGSELQAGLVPVTNETTGGEMAWYGVANGAWVAMTGLVPKFATDYTLRAEYDYGATAPKVRYTVIETATPAVLTTASGDEWHTISSVAKGLTQVQLYGQGSFTSMAGSRLDGGVVNYDGTNYTSFAEALAAANGDTTKTLKLLTNLDWRNAGAGVWKLDVNGKTLLIPAEGMRVDEGGIYWGDYFEAYVYDGSSTNKYTYLTNAIALSATATTNGLLRDVTSATFSKAITLSDKAIFFDGGTNELAGAGIAVKDTGKFTVLGGYIGVDSLSKDGDSENAAIVLQGGKYKEGVTNIWAAFVPENYHYAKLAEISALYGEYVAQIIKGAEPENPDDEVVYPVVQDGEGGSGSIAFSDAWIKANVTSETDPAKVAEELNKTGANGAKVWESYVLGLNPKQASDKPVIAPRQTTVASKVTFQLGNVTVNAAAGATVGFKVLTIGEPGGSASAASDIAPADGTISVDLPENGVKYYRLEVITKPAN